MSSEIVCNHYAGNHFLLTKLVTEPIICVIIDLFFREFQDLNFFALNLLRPW
jgi:hypothetical protein